MSRKLMKKGAWHLEEMGKLLIVIVLIVIIATFSYLARDKIIATLHTTFLGNFA